MSESSSSKSENVEVIYEAEVDLCSGEDPPMSEWSSLVVEVPEENKKKFLMSQGLYSPGSGEVCTKYIGMSDSSVFRHPYYNYPAVLDPGIKAAILSPEAPVIYGDDGRDLYKALCSEMNMCPVRMFHRNLLNDDINLSYYGVNPKGVRAMAMALQYNKFVRRFDLTDNFLDDDASYHLGTLLTSNITLKELILAGCRMGPSGILRLGEGLTVNRSLKVFNVARNNFGEEGGAYFAKQISDGMVIPRVNLSNNKLGKVTALALAEALEFSNKLTHLDLSWNNFFHTPSTVKMLNQIAYSEVLQELNLAYNSLENEAIAAAIQNILLIPTLKILDLSNNKFKEDSIRLISLNLLKAKKLETLDLSFNPMSPEDANVIIQKMLKPRVKIQNLYLESVCVDQRFEATLTKVRNMKSRKNFVITYGAVLHNWAVTGPDPRDLILQRADYLGNKDKKHRIDIALFFLRLYKENPKPIPVKDLIDRVAAEGAPLDDGLVNELTYVFPGPKSAKTRFVNIQLIAEYIERIWPDRKLPPTPPPEPEPEPIPEPPAKKGKSKGKK